MREKLEVSLAKKINTSRAILESLQSTNQTNVVVIQILLIAKKEKEQTVAAAAACCCIYVYMYLPMTKTRTERRNIEINKSGFATLIP